MHALGLYNYVVPAEQNFPYKWKDFSYRPAPPPPMLNGPMGGLGAWGVSPAAAAISMISKRGMRGYGEAGDPGTVVTSVPIETPVAGTILAFATLVLGVYAVASFYAGKAMAPSANVKSRWGWYGVLGGLLGGPLGLGVVGVASLSERNDFLWPRQQTSTISQKVRSRHFANFCLPADER